MDSAMLTSGSLPMSSAEIASTTEVASCLTAIAFSMPRRMPVTCTVSRLVAAVVAGVVVLCVDCADASVGASTTASARLSALRLWFNIFPSQAMLQIDL